MSDSANRLRVQLLLSWFWLLALPGGLSADDPGDRPASWAQPLAVAGVPNLHRVSADLYRSGQPTAAGMANLERMGIRTIVSLRSFHSDRDELKGRALAYERISMKAWHPERKEAVRFLKILADPERAPVLVHCQHGSDRTGTLCAVYRVVVQGWTKKEAIREMTQGGFGFHRIFRNLPKWLDQLDVDSIKKEIGQ